MAGTARQFTGSARTAGDPKRGVIMSIKGSENIAVTTTIEQTNQKLLGISATGVVNTRSVLTEFNGVKLSDE